MTHISTTQQKVDPDKYGEGYDRIFRKKDAQTQHDHAQIDTSDERVDKCKICGHDEHNDICEEILRQQRDRT